MKTVMFDQLMSKKLIAILLFVCLLATILSAAVIVAQPSTTGQETDGERVHVVAAGETLWVIAARYDSSVEAIVEANQLADPGLLRIGQRLTIPDLANDVLILVPTAVLQPVSPLVTPTNSQPELRSVEPQPSEVLTANAHHYTDMARSNIRTVNGRRAVVPSPIYANGIYARDAFYALVGLEDMDLSEESFRWFEGAQNPETGQITTAVPFDPADTSLQPQDDETALLFLIWAGLLHRDGRPVDMDVVENAWRFIQRHVEDDLYVSLYVSPAGEFRYWADCWDLSGPDVISYNQGFYALAARFALEMGIPGVTQQTVDDAMAGYQARYRPDLGFTPLSAWHEGSAVQDVSALLPELLHRLYFGVGMLGDGAVLSTVDHHLATASVFLDDGALIGIKNMATASGGFAHPDNFACESMRRPGDYHNGGYWPMYTLAEVALAYSIEPRQSYRTAIEQLVVRELTDGSPKEYWELSPGREGTLQPGRDDYSWNALLVPAFRYAGLID